MRYIENMELREWVKENLRKAIFHKAHALAVQTGCEILVKLQDDVSEAVTPRNCYYATDKLGGIYSNKGVHKQSDEVAISGVTGLPVVSMMDRGIQSKEAGTNEACTEPITNDVLGKSSDDDLTVVKESSTTTDSPDANTTQEGGGTESDSDEDTPVPMQLSLTCTNEADSITDRLSGGDANGQQNIKQETTKDDDDVRIKVEVIDDDDDDNDLIQMASEHVDDMDSSNTLQQSYQVEDSVQPNYPVPMSPKPYQCGMCQKAFRSIQVLQKHTQTFHQRAQHVVTARSRGRGYGSGMMKQRQQQFQVPSSASGQHSVPSTSQQATSPVNNPLLWINNFVLPEFPVHVMTGLEVGKVLSSRDESVILDAIFEAVRPHTVYPRHVEYSSLIDMLLHKFPQIGDEINFTKPYWVKKLQHKFQNVRKRDPTIKDMLAVRSRKRKEEPSPRGSKATRRSLIFPPIHGLQNFLPSRHHSQSNTSIKRNHEWLQAEILNENPDVEQVFQTMSLTFPDRRKDIVQKQSSIQDIQEKYPWLFIEHEFFAEFKRIHGDKDMKQLLEAGLHKYAGSIVDSFTTSRAHHKMNIDLKLNCSGMNAIQRQNAYIDAAIFVLPTMLREDANDMFTFKDDHNVNSVFISTNWKSPLESTEFIVFAEGSPVCTTDDYMTAVASYFATFFVFNLPYVEKLEKTIVFVQKFILGINDGGIPCKPILTLMSRLNRAINKGWPVFPGVGNNWR